MTEPYAYVGRWAKRLVNDLRLVPCAQCPMEFYLPARDALAGGRRPWYCGMECFRIARTGVEATIGGTMSKDRFVTDINRRERKRFGEELRLFARLSMELAEAIETADGGDDAPALQALAIWASGVNALCRDLIAAYKDGQMVSVPDTAEGAERERRS
jgi:hypothetical protein